MNNIIVAESGKIKVGTSDKGRGTSKNYPSRDCLSVEKSEDGRRKMEEIMNYEL